MCASVSSSWTTVVVVVLFVFGGTGIASLNTGFYTAARRFDLYLVSGVCALDEDIAILRASAILGAGSLGNDVVLATAMRVWIINAVLTANRRFEIVSCGTVITKVKVNDSASAILA